MRYTYYRPEGRYMKTAGNVYMRQARVLLTQKKLDEAEDLIANAVEYKRTMEHRCLWGGFLRE
jgi:hypothetical protein